MASSVTSTITKKHTLIYWSKLVKFKRFRSTDAKTFFVKNHWSLGQDISKEKEANAIVNFVLILNRMKNQDISLNVNLKRVMSIYKKKGK